MSEGFLSRWSRRKQEVRQAENRDVEPIEGPVEEMRDLEGPGSVVPAVSDETVPGAVEPPAAPDDSAEPALTEEEIAALPSIESITAETDIRSFLRKGVPEALRKAALRRSWVLDPMIRDYVDPAREYAYDWNVPGGVPGSGSLLPSDDVDRLLRDVFPDLDSRGRPVVDGTDGVARPESPTPPSGDGTPPAVSESIPNDIGSVRVSQYPLETNGPKPDVVEMGGTGSDTAGTEQNAGKASQELPTVAETSLHRRRHGGAMPV